MSARDGQAASTAGRGRLVVMSGPSGSGKTTIKSRLRRHPAISVAVTVTTRPQRPGEQDGRDYHFVAREEFLRMAAAQRFVETNDVFGTGHLYGSLKDELDAALATAGTVYLMEVDVTGARNIRQAGYEALFVFVAPPSRVVLEQRLRARGTDDDAAILRRLSRYDDEVASALADGSRFVINHRVDDAVREFYKLIGLKEPAPAAGS